MMDRTASRMVSPAVLAFLWAGALAAASLDPGAVRQADEIFRATGVKGGLAVDLGCGNGRLTAALLRNGIGLVHGLDADAAKIRRARTYIRSLGLYGRVSVEQWTGARLPYVDNAVNLLVAESGMGVPQSEIMRVLAPRGVAYVKQGDGWQKIVKPVPPTIDEWTHYRYDASGNAVAHDQVVGPPRRLQWVAGPEHGRSHEFTASTSTLVSSGGRIFYIADEAPTGSLQHPAEWRLVARDGFNGLLLWQRPIAPWYSYLSGWTSAPRELQRRMVAIGDRVYVTLGYFGAVQVLDAATGKTVRSFPQTLGAEEIVYHRGILLAVVRAITEDERAYFDKLAALTAAPNSPLHMRETRRPLFRVFRHKERAVARSIVAIDAATGALRWRVPAERVRGIRPLSLRASGDRVFYQARHTVALSLKDGSVLWSERTDPVWTLDKTHMVCANNRTKQITVLDAGTGKTLWTRHSLLTLVHGAFIIDGALWLGGFKPYDNGRKKYNGPVWGPHFATKRDLQTGKLLMQIDTQCPGHHQRCYDSVATDRYLLVGRRGTEFYDLKTGEVYWNSWARGVCRYGVMPCNGLLYKPPHACGCYITVQLEGFNALAPARSAAAVAPVLSPADRLEKGPAYGSLPAVSGGPDPSPDSWPMYRRDPSRSGCSDTDVPPKVAVKWQADVAPGLTPPTVAEGKVFVSCRNRDLLVAMAVGSGKVDWQATACGRIDSPPTVVGGRVLFGCRDGCAYCLRATDGQLVWRFRAAAVASRTVAYGALESVSPIHGSVLVQNGVVTFTSGRSSYLDGGIRFWRLKASTGELISNRDFLGPALAPGPKPLQYGPSAMPGARWDILSADAENLYLQDKAFDKSGVLEHETRPHLFALTGFLDDSWAHRSYWIYGTRASIATGCSGRLRDLCFGRLLVVGNHTVYGYGRRSVHWSNAFRDGPYRLFARQIGERQPTWSHALPIQVRAMVKAGDVLFVAGPEVTPRGEAGDGPGTGGAWLLSFSAADGSELSRCALPAPPVFDGMAAAGKQLFLTLKNGAVLCLAGR